MTQRKISTLPYIKYLFSLSAIISIVVILIFTWFTWRIYKSEEERIIRQLQNEASHIDSSFKDTFDHTSFIMKMMMMQITPNYEDNVYINNIISKYRTNPNITNVLSWTIFSWANAKHLITVDALYGILDNPIDLSSRDYIPLTQKEPGVLKLGKPVIGSTSKRWMIPAGIGAVDAKGKYIGTMTIGFDIENLKTRLKNSIKSEGIEFALIDADNLNIILTSSDRMSEFGYSEAKIKDSDLKESLSSAAKEEPDIVFSDANIFNNYQNYYLYKIPNYNYLMYLKYDSHYLKHEVWQALTSRFIEILCIGLVAIIVSLFIYRREIKLKEAETAHKEALLASKAKSEFLAYTNHELRSPLNGIILASEMMQKKIFGELSDAYIAYAKDINDSGVELLQFIEDLLDEAQAKTGNFSIIEKETNIRNVIQRAIKLNISKATKHSISIKVEVDDNFPLLWVDPKRFRQILNNLISNSVKYSPPNTNILISATREESGLSIIVEDQGFGMTEEDLKTALVQYGTIKNENSENVESIGLGLPLVKQLVEAHNSLLIIESEPGKGTKISIKIPKEKIFN